MTELETTAADATTDPIPATTGAGWPIDEATRRRPAFVGVEAGAEPIPMADGQRWILPPARVGLSVRRNPHSPDGESILAWTSADDRLRTHYDRFLRAEDPGRRLLAKMDAIRLMLILNYDLSEDEAGRLVSYYPDDPESVRIAGEWDRHFFGGQADRAAATGDDDPEDGRPKA